LDRLSLCIIPGSATDRRHPSSINGWYTEKEKNTTRVLFWPYYKVMQRSIYAYVIIFTAGSRQQADHLLTRR
jgi:hypothetical protein